MVVVFAQLILMIYTLSRTYSNMKLYDGIQYVFMFEFKPTNRVTHSVHTPSYRQ
jgi:hypothetical protein